MSVLSEEKKYQDITRLEDLKWRVKNCRCRYCGAPLKLRRILYGNNPEGRVEIFCTECDRIEYGVDPEIYAVSKYFVEEFNFNIFPNNDVSEKTKQMNIAKICDIIAWGCKNMGILSARGFNVPLDLTKSILGEDVIFHDDDLTDVKIDILDTGANVCQR